MREAVSSTKSPMSSAKRDACGAVIGYGVLAIVYFWPLIQRFTTHILASDVYGAPGQSDSYTFLWMRWWVTKSLLHGWNFYFCHWVLPPFGANFVWHGGIVLVPTLATLPLNLVLGPVAGYNAMVLLLLVSAAWVYYFFLRKTFRLSFASAFIAGALFGFNPMFVFKAHGHINMLGAYSWAGALGLAYYIYTARRFTWQRGIAFAIVLWTAFWTSFVEFFMLGIALAATLVVLEVQGTNASGPARAFRRLARFLASKETLDSASDRLGPPPASSLRRRVTFFIPSIAGALSFLLFGWADRSQSIANPLVDVIRWREFFLFPRLSLFSSFGFPAQPEAWGAVLPYSVLVLTLVGIVCWFHRRERGYGPALILGLLFLAATLNLLHVPSTIIRALPLGEGFRVFTRFYPFMLFFLLPFAALGLDILLRKTQPTDALGPGRSLAETRVWMSRRSALAGLLILTAAVELYPAQLGVSVVPRVELSDDVRGKLAPTACCLVVPYKTYTPMHDTYQVSLDMPCVNLARWDKQSMGAKTTREQDYPLLYKDALKVYPEKPDIRADGFLEQARALRVKYILFEDKLDLQGFPWPGTVMWESSRELLLELE